MARNLQKFPSDLGEIPEHHHFMAFRIYSNSSASLGGATKTIKPADEYEKDITEEGLLSELDSNRGQKPTYSDAAESAGADHAASVRAQQQRLAAAKLAGENTRWWVPGFLETDEQEYLDKTAGGGFGYGGALKAVVKDTTYARAKKINQDAIYLPMPQNINMSDGWNWETVSFQKSAIGEMMKGDFKEGMIKAMATTVGGVGKIAGENIDKLIMHSQRMVANPRKETLFNEPQMRTFVFEYDLAPRNIKESDAAQAIINLFKYHASPELLDGVNALYNYPSEFQIYFISNNDENNYLGRIDRCALTNVAVNYTNANMWSAFKETGAPTHLKLTLEFTELSLQSRDSLMKLDGIYDKSTIDIAGAMNSMLDKVGKFARAVGKDYQALDSIQKTPTTEGQALEDVGPQRPTDTVEERATGDAQRTNALHLGNLGIPGSGGHGGSTSNTQGAVS